MSSKQLQRLGDQPLPPVPIERGLETLDDYKEQLRQLYYYSQGLENALDAQRQELREARRTWRRLLIFLNRYQEVIWDDEGEPEITLAKYQKWYRKIQNAIEKHRGRIKF